MPQLLALSLQVTCRCPAARFPLIPVLPNTSLQVTAYTLWGSSARNSSPAPHSSEGSFANLRQEGSLLQRAGEGLLPGCMWGQRHPLSVRPREPRGTRQLPLLCNQLWADPYGKQGCTIKLKERIRKKQTNQPNKQAGHTHPLSGIQLADRTDKRYTFRKPWHLSSAGLQPFPCMCTVPQIPQGEKAKMVQNLQKSNWRL